MNLLLDACISAKARDALAAAGYDVIWIGDGGQDPGDETILAQAYSEGRVLITLDKDFGELAVLRGLPHCSIVRLVNFRSAQQGPAILQILKTYANHLRLGAIITAEPGRVRIRSRFRP